MLTLKVLHGIKKVTTFAISINSLGNIITTMGNVVFLFTNHNLFFFEAVVCGIIIMSALSLWHEQRKTKRQWRRISKSYQGGILN